MERHFYEYQQYVFSRGNIKKYQSLWLKNYDIYPKYWDRQACANSVDQDQMQQNAASDLSQH